MQLHGYAHGGEVKQIATYCMLHVFTATPGQYEFKLTTDQKRVSFFKAQD